MAASNTKRCRLKFPTKGKVNVARSKNKNNLSGIIVGPILIVVGILALWSNEGRFDYAAAARATKTMNAPTTEFDNELISYTGSMETDLTIPGEYVESLVGYLTVNRYAEIYAWDEDEDEDGNVTWSREWMSSVDSNSRNRRDNVSQELSSKLFRPDTYNLGKLTINGKSIEFVDDSKSIPTSTLTLNNSGKASKLNKQRDYLFLAKSGANQVGDERVSYSGVPVPVTATYFGKYEYGHGVAHQAEQKDSFIEDLIGDTGVLHFIVAGERSVALNTMQQHLTRTKWLFRGGGFLAITIGFSLMFGAVAGFLYHVPLLGSIIQSGVLIVSLTLGATVSIITITASYLMHNLWILALMIAVGVALFLLLRLRGLKSQANFKQGLALDMGQDLDEVDLAELEFIELVRLCFADKDVHIEERKYLTKWAKKQGWSKEKIAELVAKAKSGQKTETDGNATDRQIRHLIRLALADGKLSRFELNTISQVAVEVGYSQPELRKLIKQIKGSVAT